MNICIIRKGLSNFHERIKCAEISAFYSLLAIRTVIDDTRRIMFFRLETPFEVALFVRYTGDGVLAVPPISSLGKAPRRGLGYDLES